MLPPDARPAAGELPGFLSTEEAVKYAKLPIDPTRMLTVFEYANMCAAHLTREEIVGMTPASLEQLADFTIDVSGIAM